MPTIIDLVEQFEKAGVLIRGREKVLAIESSANWPAALVLLATRGVHEGVQFFRSSEDVSVLSLDRILNGYPLTYEQRDAIVNNILLDQNAPKPPAFEILRREL